jgi:phosphate transport system substrate-binding protein
MVRWQCGLLLGLLLAVAAGCEPADPPGSGAGSGGASRGTLRIDGSSTVFKLTQAVAETFGKENPGVSIKVDKSGTGGGFKKFVRGQIDICDASRPIQQSEMQLCRENGIEYIELPVCFDAVTIAVNIQNDWCDSMTTEELKRLWAPEAHGKITRWSQIRAGWPDVKISLFGADRDSGTFEYFTEAIVEQKNASRTDYQASADDNAILLGIEGERGALGYVPYAYFAPREGRTMKAVKIDAGQGPVAPSVETVKNATYVPLSRPLFIYVNRQAAERPEVKRFVEFYLANGAQLAELVKYIPLTDEAYEMGRERFNRLQTGTGFGGHSEFGLPLEELLKREPTS